MSPPRSRVRGLRNCRAHRRRWSSAGAREQRVEQRLPRRPRWRMTCGLRRGAVDLEVDAASWARRGTADAEVSSIASADGCLERRMDRLTDMPFTIATTPARISGMYVVRPVFGGRRAMPTPDAASSASGGPHHRAASQIDGDLPIVTAPRMITSRPRQATSRTGVVDRGESSQAHGRAAPAERCPRWSWSRAQLITPQGIESSPGPAELEREAEIGDQVVAPRRRRTVLLCAAVASRGADLEVELADQVTVSATSPSSRAQVDRGVGEVGRGLQLSISIAPSSVMMEAERVGSVFPSSSALARCSAAPSTTMPVLAQQVDRARFTSSGPGVPRPG